MFEGKHQPVQEIMSWCVIIMSTATHRVFTVESVIKSVLLEVRKANSDFCKQFNPKYVIYPIKCIPNQTYKVINVFLKLSMEGLEFISSLRLFHTLIVYGKNLFSNLTPVT